MDSHPQILHTGLRTLRVEPANDSIQLMKLWRVIWNSKFSIAALVIFVTLMTVVAVTVMTPVYRATATLLMDDSKKQVVSFDTAGGGERSNSQYIETQAEIIRSRSLATQVVQTLGFTSDPVFKIGTPGQSDSLIKRTLVSLGLAKVFPGLNSTTQVQTATPLLDSVTRQFMDTVTVDPQGKSQLVKVQVEMVDPNKAALATNTLVQAYIDGQAKANIGMSESASVWMNGRIKELAEQLKESETRLQAYREAENLVDVQGVSTISATELSMTSERMIDARRARAEAESEYRQVQGLGQDNWQRLVTVPAVMADPVVRQFKADQARANSKLLELSSRYGPRHPAVDSARTELDAATASLRGQVEQVVAGIERNYQLAAANESSLKASVNTNKSQIQDISRKEFKLQALQREVDSNRQLYDTFLNRLKETTATADLASNSTRIIDLAAVPNKPVKPNKPVLVALAFLLSLFLGCALALLRDALKNTFSSIDQIENRLNLPVLGIVPLMKRRKRKDLAKVFNDHNHHRFSEAIRSIRTGVILANPADRHLQVIVMTSSIPGEGKTTVSINLARALGKMEKVLLIDADLRRSTVGEAFGFAKGRVGLTDLINGSATLAECIQEVDGIDVLCAGSGTSSPLELLSSPRFAKALELLKGKYRRIVIDTPPVQAVSDAVVLSTLADSTILVVKSPTTRSSLVEKAVAQLLQHRAPLRGVIVNHVDIKKSLRTGQRFDGYYDYYDYSASASVPS
ncbi:MAG: GumC family protein [Janthinobacterium lividum]